MPNYSRYACGIIERRPVRPWYVILAKVTGKMAHAVNNRGTCRSPDVGPVALAQ